MSRDNGRNIVVDHLMSASGKRLSRRTLLQLSALTATGSVLTGLLAACGDDVDTPAAVDDSSAEDDADDHDDEREEEAATDDAKTGGTLRVGYAEPSSLDPQYISGVLEGNLVGLVYDGLMTQDPYTEEHTIGPLCESFEVSEDQLAWTFYLKEGITFHDGTPFTAAVVKECYEHAADPENAAWVTPIYLPTDGTYEAPDDTTFIIRSPEPYGPMAIHLAWDAWFGIYSPPAREQFGEDYGRNPVGTGPFKFREWVAGDFLTLERNPEYTWGEEYLEHGGPAYIEEISVRFIQEQSTIVAALQSEDIDIAFLPNQFYDEFEADARFEILTRPSGRLVCLGWNHERWPFDDIETRRALSHGFDRERFLQVMEEGRGQVMYGMIVPSIPHYWPGEQEEGPEYDPERARAMLADAGWEDTDGDGIIERDGNPFRVTLISGGTDEFVRWSSLVQSQARDLGIEVAIDTLETAALTARLNDGDYDFFRFIYDTVTPDILTFFFHSNQIPVEGGSGLNRSRVSDPRLDELTEEQRRTLGQEERDAVVEELVRHMMDQAVVLPLYSPEKHTVVNNRVRDVIFFPNAMDWNLTEAWIEE
jgi:peptide/nickel transport system substrate-binding protein